MKFSLAHAVAVPPARAIAAYASPAFYEGRPIRHHIEVLGVVRHEESGPRVLMEVRFAFRGPVSPAVRAVVDHTKLSWITRTEVFREEARSEWMVLPDHYSDRLSGKGDYRFEEGPEGPDSTRVRVEGEMKVHVPIVGRSVERAIVSGLRRYLDDEVAGIADCRDFRQA